MAIIHTTTECNLAAAAEQSARPRLAGYYSQSLGAGRPDRRPWRLFVLIVAALSACCGGCGASTKAVNAADAACLAALAPCNPSHKVNEAGRVVELNLEGKAVDDRALDQVKNLSELRKLSLYGSSISDEGLAKLSGLTYLEALGLGATPVTDRGLTYLEKLPSLHWIWLTEDKQITAQAVENLKKRALPGLTVYR